MLSSLLHDVLMVNSNRSEAFAFNFLAPHMGVAVLVTLNSIFNLQSGHYSYWQLQVFILAMDLCQSNSAIDDLFNRDSKKSGPPVVTVIADLIPDKENGSRVRVTFTGRRAQIF